MYIYKLTIWNFASFNGLHCFNFREGLNLITCPSGVGKTNLVRSLKLAFTGNTCINNKTGPLDLFNNQNPDTYFGVKAEIISENGLGKCLYSARVDGNRLYSSHSVPAVMAQKHPDFPYNVYVEGECDRYLRENVVCKMLESVKDDCGVLILEHVWEHLTEVEQFSLLHELESSDLDQVIIMENKFPLIFSEFNKNVLHVIDLPSITANTLNEGDDEDHDSFYDSR
jgi:AAA15 family ATPase/GTPase